MVERLTGIVTGIVKFLPIFSFFGGGGEVVGASVGLVGIGMVIEVCIFCCLFMPERGNSLSWWFKSNGTWLPTFFSSNHLVLFNENFHLNVKEINGLLLLWNPGDGHFRVVDHYVILVVSFVII